jgi:hypothetical protein
VPYESILHGSLVICMRCRDGDASRSPVFPSWFMARHDAWHDGHAARDAGEPPDREEDPDRGLALSA